MEQIITQKDEKCSGCGKEMPKGSYSWVNGDGNIFCDDNDDCFEEGQMDVL